MKISHYALDAPTKGLYKQHCIIARDSVKGGYAPLVYLQRPKWIKDDSALVFGTLKSLPAQLPESILGVWIENGTAGQIKEAA